MKMKLVFTGCQNKIFISNKWDTIYIDATEDKEKSLIFYEVLPARGPGRRELELKDLRVNDSKTSDALLNLIQKIEIETGIRSTTSPSFTGNFLNNKLSLAKKVVIKKINVNLSCIKPMYDY